VSGYEQYLADVRIYGCQFYYNLLGGMCLDSERRSGMVSIHGCRFERSGSTPGNPAVNLNADSPGIRIQRAVNIDLVQCSTDANSGPGLEIIGNTAASIYTYGITVSDCKFARDGGGDQSVNTAIPGVKLKGCSNILMSNIVITWGQADDSGGAGPVTPYYSVWFENTVKCKIVNSWIDAPELTNSVYMTGTNNGSSVEGAGSYIDLTGTDTQNKEVRFRIADGAGTTVTRWVAGVNPTASGGAWSVQRYDATGAYVDSPLNLRWSDGMVSSNQMYLKSNAANRIPLEVRAFDQSPTVSLMKVGLGDGTSKFEVLYNGTLRANWGSTSHRVVQLGSTQIVRENAVGAYTLLACYTSVANADAGTSVFEVRPNGVKIPAATELTDAVQKTQVKALVAASTDFADLKARFAAW
jgi:hypothetical protein